MKPFPLLAVITVAFIAFAGCSSDSDSNPTDNNNNNSTPALSMKLNGELWEPKGQQGSAVYADMHLDIGETDFMYLNADKVINSSAYQYDDLKIKIDSPGLGTFTLGSTSSAEHYATFQRQTDATHIDLYHTREDAAGTITITKYDTANQLISGTFSFIASIPLSTPLKVATVTEGTFTNVKWYVR